MKYALNIKLRVKTEWSFGNPFRPLLWIRLCGDSICALTTLNSSHHYLFRWCGRAGWPSEVLKVKVYFSADLVDTSKINEVILGGYYLVLGWDGVQCNVVEKRLPRLSLKWRKWKTSQVSWKVKSKCKSWFSCQSCQSGPSFLSRDSLKGSKVA